MSNQNQKSGEPSTSKNVIVINSFLDDLRKFLALDDFKDFTLIAKDGKIKVHKLILAARCETFAEMIRSNSYATELDLSEFSLETLKCVSDFVYFDKQPKSKNVLAVFAAAGFLKFKGLKNTTAGLLIQSINEFNLEKLYRIFQIADKYEQIKLRARTFEAIKKHIPNLKDEVMEQPQELKRIVEAKLSFERGLK